MNVTLYGKSDFADVIKDFEMGRSSWIIQVGPKCNHRCPCKRNVEGGLTVKGQVQCDKEVERGKSHVYKEGVRSKQCRQLPEARKGKEIYSPLGPPEANVALPTFWF